MLRLALLLGRGDEAELLFARVGGALLLRRWRRFLRGRLPPAELQARGVRNRVCRQLVDDHRDAGRARWRHQRLEDLRDVLRDRRTHLVDGERY